MKRQLSLLLLAGTIFLAASAQAAPVFMLQFGSFESRDEADSKLAALKTKHAGVLSRMETSVREVTLPPDNLTVYRTQAGPLATREDAQSVCSQLASNGDDCYVVETAMIQPTTPPTHQVAAAAPAQAPAAAAVATPAPAPTPAPIPAATPAPAPMAIAQAAPVTPPTPPVAPVAPVVSAPAAAPAPAFASETARDPRNVAALNSVAPAAMPSPVNDNSMNGSATDADVAMQHELEQAAARQKAGTPLAQPSPFASTSVGVSPATTATRIADDKKLTSATPAKPPRSLWDRLFGSSESAPAPKPLPPTDAVVQAAPVAPVIMATPAPMPTPAPMMEAPAPMASPAPIMMTAAPMPASAPAPVPAPMPAPAPLMAPPAPIMAAPATAPTPMAMQQAPVQQPRMVADAAPFPLPPPPAPLRAETRAALERGEPMTVPAPLPITATPMPAPVIAPQPTGAVPVIAPVPAANVRVEEAKRVPLTQATASAPIPAAAPIPMTQSVLPPSLRPSATIGQKTLWAEMGSFANTQAALSYWDQYRRAHPDFPVVRVRVTSPLMAQQRGLSQVNLRIGPFAAEGFIKNLCDSLPDNDDDLRCGAITDLGVASDLHGQHPGYISPSRYSR